jgi:ZIP family zinc transporter
VLAAVLGVAAGAILAMLADTMMPEAFEQGGHWVALFTVVGFACAFLLGKLQA